MKVRNIISERSGRPVANQFVIEHDGKVYFQSYNSRCAVVDNGKLTLGSDWDYSNTTRKYLYIFMREYAYMTWCALPTGKSGSDSIRKAIDAGKIGFDVNMR